MHRGREKVREEEEVGLWPSPPIPSFALLLSPCFLAKIYIVRRRLQRATGLGERAGVWTGFILFSKSVSGLQNDDAGEFHLKSFWHLGGFPCPDPAAWPGPGRPDGALYTPATL